MKIAPLNNYQIQNRKTQNTNFGSSLEIGKEVLEYMRYFPGKPLRISEFGHLLRGDGTNNVVRLTRDVFSPRLTKEKEAEVLGQILLGARNYDEFSEAADYVGRLSKPREAAAGIKDLAETSKPRQNHSGHSSFGSPEPNVVSKAINAITELEDPGEAVNLIRYFLQNNKTDSLQRGATGAIWNLMGHLKEREALIRELGTNKDYSKNYWIQSALATAKKQDPDGKFALEILGPDGKSLGIQKQPVPYANGAEALYENLSTTYKSMAPEAYETAMNAKLGNFLVING